jgi:hypothetical protein
MTTRLFYRSLVRLPAAQSLETTARAHRTGNPSASPCASMSLSISLAHSRLRESKSRLCEVTVFSRFSGVNLCYAIDLPALTIAALREHRIRQGYVREWAGSGWKGNDWNLVFTTSVGTPLDENRVLRRFQDRILRKSTVILSEETKRETATGMEDALNPLASSLATKTVSKPS